MDSDDRSFLRRPHLMKHQRLPRSYKEVEKILKDVKACRGTVRTLLNNSRLRGSVLKKVYALSVNVLRNRRLLDKIIKDTQLLERERFLREDLAEILVHELIFGKGLPGESRPVTAVKNYRLKILDSYQDAIKFDSLSFKDPLTIPRYVRVNTLRTSVTNVVNNFTNANYRHIQYGKETSEKEYFDLVRKLEPCSFLIDYHFKDLLVFSHFENVQNWIMFKKNLIYIQDKSSYISIFALDPKPGSTFLDACAAPGMKTLHAAAIMENKGKIYAIEKSSSRFKTLEDMLYRAPVKICEAKCMDFYSVDTNDPKYNSVEYILVDPSCSGSGMVNRMDPVTDTKDSKTVSRLEKLAGFQILLLKHALSFPSVKRVVYSTCSLSEEENEYVVHEVLETFKRIFKLVRVMPEWPIRGMDEYKFGKFCLRANPEKTLTNGFFVAMFERMTYEETQRLSRDEWFFKDKWTRKKNKRKENWWPKDDYNDSDVLSEAFGSCSTSDLENSTSTLNNDSSSSHSSLKRRKIVRVRCASRELTDSSEMSNRPNYRSSASIVTSENYSSEGSIISTSATNEVPEGAHCSRENIHPDERRNNGSENKQKKTFAKTKGNVNAYKSAKEVYPTESSPSTTSSEEEIKDCSSYHSGKVLKNKKKHEKHFLVKECCSPKIQDEFLCNDMNMPDIGDNSNVSDVNSHNSSKIKKKGTYLQDTSKQILRDESMDSKVRADNLNESSSKANFSNNLDEVHNSTSQCESNKIEAYKEKKRHGVKKILNNPESVVESEQTFEPQDTPEKKHYISTESGERETESYTEQTVEPQETLGKKHTIKESMECNENVNETVSYTEQTIETQDTLGKKRKKKHTNLENTESGESGNVSCAEQTVEPEETHGKKRKKKHTSTESIECNKTVNETASNPEQNIETQDTLGKKRKKKHTSNESIECNETASNPEQNIETQDTLGKKHTSNESIECNETASNPETQDTPGKKLKKKHTSPGSIESGKGKSESVSCTEQIVETQDAPGKKSKKKHSSSESTGSGENVSEIVSYTKQSVETQDTHGKKRKKRHYTSTESTYSSENVNEAVAWIVKPQLKKKHKKKCKDKKTKEE